MDIKLNNPIELISLCLLGLGFSVMYSRMPDGWSIDAEINAILWEWNWTWVFGGGDG